MTVKEQIFNIIENQKLKVITQIIHIFVHCFCFLMNCYFPPVSSVLHEIAVIHVLFFLPWSRGFLSLVVRHWLRVGPFVGLQWVLSVRVIPSRSNMSVILLATG